MGPGATSRSPEADAGWVPDHTVSAMIGSVFIMRFDLRAPDFGAPAADLYTAAPEMAAWAESRGAVAAVVSEHHTMDDGYVPAPLLIAAAIAARTTTLPIMTAALVLPLHDPVRLAEEFVVLDILSRGRASHVLAVGYREVEFEHLGVEFGRRGKIADAHLDVLLQAMTGEPFTHDGRRIHVTPAPFTPGGPVLYIGGGSPAAVRRAARHGLGFFAQGGGRELIELYRTECRAHGFEPGFCLVPPPDMPTTVFVADDVDAAWRELGPHLLHDVHTYAAANPAAAQTASMSVARDLDELRAEQGSHRIMSVDEAVGFIRSGNVLQLNPLIGGLDPEVAWRYLRTVTDEVVPRL